MLKLLLVIDSLSVGGTERSTTELLPLFEEAGLEVLVVVLAHGAEDDGEISPETPVLSLRRSGFIGQVRGLRQLLRAQEPDIVHSALYRANQVTRLAAVGLPVTVVSSIVNTPYEPERFDDPNLARWKLRAVQVSDAATSRFLTDHFHAVSAAAASSASRHLRIPEDRITVVHRGRARSRLEEPSPRRRAAVRESLGIPADTPVVLSVGRQEFQKGFDSLVEAAALDEGPSIYLIAGRSGAATEALEARLSDPVLRDRVRLLGQRDDVPDLLAAADVYLTTSLFEGLPGAVIEAMAMSLPVVGFDIPPVREVVDSEGALLCEPGDIVALAGLISELVENRGLAAAMGARGRAAYEERLTLECSARGMLDLYRDLVE